MRVTLQSQVRAVLADQEWHCRQHEYKDVPSGQLAGGGGIQGLQRGSKAQAGLIIESQTFRCEICQVPTRHDRWTGEYREAQITASIPKKLRERILELYDFTDAVELRKRPEAELIIDHRFPMERWGGPERPNRVDDPDETLVRKFQLLKKDASGNHNLLKSRACEHCLATRERGTPFGIRFFYAQGATWPEEVPERGPKAEVGCHGCGWYNLLEWRRELNLRIAESGGDASVRETVRAFIPSYLSDGESDQAD